MPLLGLLGLLALSTLLTLPGASVPTAAVHRTLLRRAGGAKGGWSSSGGPRPAIDPVTDPVTERAQALLEARHSESEWPGVFASTTGLVFFGTPFRGAEGMSQVEMLAAARQEYEEDEVQMDVLKILEPGNEFLQEVVDQFGKTRRLANKAQVACFYELKSSNVGRIVGKADRTVRPRS